MRRRSARAGVALGLVLLAAGARAQTVSVSVAPALGADTPVSGGWSSYFVTVRGVGAGVTRGVVELGDGSGATSRAPFAVAAGESVDVELPLRDAFGKGLEVLVRDASGAPLAKAPAPSPRARVPLLFDLGRSGRLDTALRNERVAARAGLPSWAPMTGLDVAVGHATADPRSGEPRFISRALGYSSATVVVAPTAVLDAMDARAFAALTDWVVGGGTLALSVSHPEDLQAARVASLVGAARAAPSKDAARFTDFLTVKDVPGGSSGPTYDTERVPTSADVEARLQGYSGEALHPTRWGAAASLGLGAVHLLAFDPTEPAFVDDQWVRRSMIDLVRSAWDRQAPIAFADGTAAAGETRFDPVRRLVDPNESNRWAIGVSAILLVLYALVAIPITFRRASRRNQPLRALAELPLWSLATLATIVAIGAVAKGGRSRARRISIVECESGATRGAVMRLRALFASSADSLRVATNDAGSLLDVTDAPSVSRVLVLDRGNAALERLQGRPWETLLVREDGFVDLGGGVSIDGETITNRLDHALVGVVARPTGGDLRYFARIGAGGSVRIDSGASLGGPVASPSPVPASASGSTTPMVAHRLEAYRFSSKLDETSSGLGAVWSALESAAPDTTDFWPDSAPTLIAEVEHGDGTKEDSGLAVESARMLVRVLGPRGEP